MKATNMIQVFGCSQAESRAGIDTLVDHLPTHSGGANMALGSILSDVQELIDSVSRRAEATRPSDVERLERARQYLNRVKDAIFNAMPIELWRGGEIQANHEVAHECSELIRVAALRHGIDFYPPPVRHG